MYFLQFRVQLCSFFPILFSFLDVIVFETYKEHTKITFLKASVRDATLRATAAIVHCNPYPLNTVFDWFAPTVAGTSCT